MIKKRLLGIALAAVAMFVWGFVYWLGIGSKIRPMKTLPADKEAAVVDALTTTETQTDVYYIPGMPLSEDTAEHDTWTEKHKAGPIVGVIYVNEGKDPMAPGVMIKGFLHMLVTAFDLAFCLCLASDRLPREKPSKD